MLFFLLLLLLLLLFQYKKDITLFFTYDIFQPISYFILIPIKTRLYIVPMLI